MGDPVPNLNREREEEAFRDLGGTRVAPALARALLAGFLLPLFAVPALEGALRAGARGARTDPPVRAAAPRDGLAALVLAPFGVSRCTLREAERRLEDGSVLARALRPWVQAALSRGLGLGNEQVYLGRGGWLFHRSGVDHLTGPPFLDAGVQRARVRDADACDGAPAPDSVAALARFGADLAARGVALVAVPVPVKGVLEGGRLAARSPAGAPLRNPSFDAWAERVRAAGVGVFDPTAALLDFTRREGRPAFLATDTHWHPDAMEAAAAALAAFLRERAPLPPAQPGRFGRGRAGARNRGDVAALLGLPPALAPPLVEVVVRPVRDRGAPWRPDPAAPVLLLGDSFANVYAERAAFARREDGEDLDWGEGAGLAEQLSFHLGLPVDRIARNAGGASDTRRDLLREVERAARAGRDRLAGVRVVVHQFAVRELSHGDWQVLALPAAAPRAETAAERPAGPLVVRGTVAARSALPEPFGAPYPDALFALHLVDVEAAGADPPPSGGVVVYLLGMRDHAWTEAARLAPGERAELRLVPWDDAEVQARVGALSRSELDDLSLLALPAFYGEPAE